MDNETATLIARNRELVVIAAEERGRAASLEHKAGRGANAQRRFNQTAGRQIRLDRRASNATLIAASLSRMASTDRLINTSEQLIRQAQRLMPRSSLAPPLSGLRDAEATQRVWRKERLTQERQEIKVMREIAYTLVSTAEEVRVESEQARWEAMHLSNRARQARERATALGGRFVAEQSIRRPPG
jgi:hypothetical protein